MEEQDYMELQILLSKLRVECLKELGNKESNSTNRGKAIKLIRNIDKIKANAPLKTEDGKIVFVKE